MAKREIFLISWLKKNKKNYSNRDDLAEACIRETGKSAKNVKNMLPAVWPYKASGKKKVNLKKKSYPKSEQISPGIEGFRHMFSRTEVQRRRVTKLQTKINEAINGVLKERTWVPDGELRDILGINSADWSNLRRDYEHLIIPDVIDENKRRYTIWAHPDHVDTLREIANE